MAEFGQAALHLRRNEHWDAAIRIHLAVVCRSSALRHSADGAKGGSRYWAAIPKNISDRQPAITSEGCANGLRERINERIGDGGHLALVASNTTLGDNRSKRGVYFRREAGEPLGHGGARGLRQGLPCRGRRFHLTQNGGSEGLGEVFGKRNRLS